MKTVFRDYFQSVRLIPNHQIDRDLNLVCSPGGWVFDCGCVLHPRDFTNSHDGGPHIHTCEVHDD